MINYAKPSSAFLYCKRWKARWGLGTRLTESYENVMSFKWEVTAGVTARGGNDIPGEGVTNQYFCCATFPSIHEL